jgi:hypothetical protein
MGQQKAVKPEVLEALTEQLKADYSGSQSYVLRCWPQCEPFCICKQ